MQGARQASLKCHEDVICRLHAQEALGSAADDVQRLAVRLLTVLEVRDLQPCCRDHAVERVAGEADAVQRAGPLQGAVAYWVLGFVLHAVLNECCQEREALGSE